MREKPEFVFYPQKHFPKGTVDEGETRDTHHEALEQDGAMRQIVAGLAEGKYERIPYLSESGSVRIRVMDKMNTLLDDDLDYFVKILAKLGIEIDEKDLEVMRLEAGAGTSHH